MLKGILQDVIAILDSCHVAGSEAKKYGEAIDALKAIVDILDKPKGEEEEHADHDKQGNDA